MNSNKIYDLLKEFIGCDGLSFSIKVKILSVLLDDTETIEALGLGYIELINVMLENANNNLDRMELMKIKLLAFDFLYYSDKFLKKNNIDLHRCFMEYLNMVKYEHTFMDTTGVLDAYFIDESYTQDINDNLMAFLSDNDKVKLLFELNQQHFENIIDYKKDTYIYQSVIYYKRIRERFNIVMKLILMTHPQKSDEIFYIFFPDGYSYESVRSDWYWSKKESYDYYVDNGIISNKESDVLYKIGDIIDNLDLKNDTVKYNNDLSNLFYEFIDNRTIIELLFPDFIKHNR